MRFTLAFTLLTTTAFSAPLFAKDFYALAPVTAATIYPQGALITRQASLELPAGTHRVLIPFTSESNFQTAPQITASEGVTILSVAYLSQRDIDPELLYTDAQLEAIYDLDEIEEEIEGQESTINLARLASKARQTELAFLTAIHPPADGASVEELSALADLVYARTAATLALIAEETRDLEGYEWVLKEIKAEHAVVLRNLERMNLPALRSDLLAITTSNSEARSVSFAVKGNANAGWRPQYDMHLTTGGTPELAVERSVMITRLKDWQSESSEVWHDIDLTLSSVRPNGQIAATEPRQNLAVIYDSQPTFDTFARVSGGAMMAPPMPAVMAESSDMSSMPMVLTDNVAVTYTYPTKVTIGVEEQVQLTLDHLSFPVETEIHATPRFDETAFFMGRLTNDGDEPLLPGMATYYRDGHFMGEAQMPMIPAGGSEMLPFGAMDGIVIERVIARNDTGETGVFTSSNIRTQEITFTVENLTRETQDVTAFYPLVFSEQEDLTIAVRANPRPDEMDVNDQRGLGAWDMTLAPGETQEVTISVRLDWPEGQELNWQP